MGETNDKETFSGPSSFILWSIIGSFDQLGEGDHLPSPPFPPTKQPPSKVPERCACGHWVAPTLEGDYGVPQYEKNVLSVMMEFWSADEEMP